MEDYPDFIIYNEEEYEIRYACTDEGEAKFIEVITYDGWVVANSHWDNPDVTEENIVEIMEAHGFSPSIEYSTVPLVTSSATDRKLDEIVRLLKKIEKNTRK